MSYTPIGKNPPNKVNRLPNRGVYDAETIYKIVDSALVAHVTFRLPADEDTDDNDWPVRFTLNLSVRGKPMRVLGDHSNDIRAKR